MWGPLWLGPIIGADPGAARIVFRSSLSLSILPSLSLSSLSCVAFLASYLDQITIALSRSTVRLDPNYWQFGRNTWSNSYISTRAHWPLGLAQIRWSKINGMLTWTAITINQNPARGLLQLMKYNVYHINRTSSCIDGWMLMNIRNHDLCLMKK